MAEQPETGIKEVGNVEPLRDVATPSTSVRRSGGTAESNEHLLRRCAVGDADAWERIVGDYERLVYAVARREGLSPDDASDVTQDVFSALLSSLDRIEEPDRLGSWLMTVARRLTWRRRVDRMRGTPTDPRLDAPSDAIADPNEAVAQALWVHEAVASLGEPCASLLRTLFFDPDEPSYEAIARILDVPIGTIGPTRSRCLSRLQRRLEAEDRW